MLRTEFQKLTGLLLLLHRCLTAQVLQPGCELLWPDSLLGLSLLPFLCSSSRPLFPLRDTQQSISMPDPHTSALIRGLSRSEISEAKAQISHLLCSLLFTLFSSQHPFQYSAQAHYKRIEQETKYYFSQGSLDTSESPCGCDLENNYFVQVNLENICFASLSALRIKTGVPMHNFQASKPLVLAFGWLFGFIW